MLKKVAWVVVFCICAAVFFCAGVYVVASGIFLSTPVVTDTFIGTVSAREYGSLSVQLIDGTTKALTVDGQTQFAYNFASPTLPKNTDVSVGKKVLVVSFGDAARYIQLLSSPVPAATSSQPTSSQP